MPKDFKKPSKKQLVKMYHTNRKSTIEIGEDLGVSNAKIVKMLKDYNFLNSATLGINIWLIMRLQHSNQLKD